MSNWAIYQDKTVHYLLWWFKCFVKKNQVRVEIEFGGGNAVGIQSQVLRENVTEIDICVSTVKEGTRCLERMCSK